MAELKTIPGNLLVYGQLQAGTFQHADQLTTERRTNPELRKVALYTADGNVYTSQKNQVLWGITRLPQNLVLQNLPKAYRQLTSTGNYFPAATAAQASFVHPDTVVIEMSGLNLEKDSEEYGHFKLDPTRVKRLSSQQKLAVQRLFGPDEDNFRQNMEMFVKAGITPSVYVLLPEYLQAILEAQKAEFVGRASRLGSFGNGSCFVADVRDVDNDFRLRGVPLVVAPQGRDEKEVVPDVAVAPREITSATIDTILRFSRDYIPSRVWDEYQAGIRERLK